MLRCIGRGAFGEVWLARTLMGAYRAVKLVYRDAFEHDRPFEREFEGIQRFEPVSREHPSQIAILHVGRNEEAGCFYYVMELADDAHGVTGSRGRQSAHASPTPKSAPTDVGDYAGIDPRPPPEPGSRGRQSAHDSPTPESAPTDVGGYAGIDPDTYLPRTLKLEQHQRGRLPVDEVLRLGTSLAISPGGRWLASGGGDAQIHLLNLTRPEAGVTTAVLEATTACLCFIGENRLVVGDRLGVVRVLSVPDLEEALSRKAHENSVTDVAYDALNGRLLTAGLDGSLRAWDLEAKDAGPPTVIGAVEAQAQVMTFLPGDHGILIADQVGGLTRFESKLPRRRMAATRLVDPWQGSRWGYAHYGVCVDDEHRARIWDFNQAEQVLRVDLEDAEGHVPLPRRILEIVDAESLEVVGLLPDPPCRGGAQLIMSENGEHLYIGTRQ